MPSPELVEVLLLDADGNLFPSEEPAFAASCDVTNEFLARLGAERRFEPAELQAVALGRNFRSVALALAEEEGVDVPEGELADWVLREQRAVTRHLGAVLGPDPAVRDALGALHRRFGLAVVSSSALARLDACLRATDLDGLLPPDRRWSAQDSLPTPTSKPDPAVYVAALAALGLAPEAALAVEDAVAGVRSAVGAGIPVVGNLVFVPQEERVERDAQLRAAGATHVVADWADLCLLLDVTVGADSCA